MKAPPSSALVERAPFGALSEALKALGRSGLPEPEAGSVAAGLKSDNRLTLVNYNLIIKKLKR